MKTTLTGILLSIVLLSSISTVNARDLADIKKEGVLRHLGVPYAGFVTGDGRGLDIELMQRFAAEIGVKYEFVATDWKNVISDLVGKKIIPDGDNVKIEGEVKVRGDVIAHGLTILPWRQKVVDYSEPTFPTQVWLISASDSSLTPIKPSGSIERDILSVKEMLAGRTVLGKDNTCLDPDLYSLEEAKALPSNFEGGLNELAPAVMEGVAETTLLDVPDALVALAKWPGKIKVLGPVSPQQYMGVAFSKESPDLRQAFALFFRKIKQDGTYRELVHKYYPDVSAYYPNFF